MTVDEEFQRRILQRDRFSEGAMLAMIEGESHVRAEGKAALNVCADAASRKIVARSAYAMADAMLKARDAMDGQQTDFGASPEQTIERLTKERDALREEMKRIIRERDAMLALEFLSASKAQSDLSDRHNKWRAMALRLGKHVNLPECCKEDSYFALHDLRALDPAAYAREVEGKTPSEDAAKPRGNEGVMP